MLYFTNAAPPKLTKQQTREALEAMDAVPDSPASAVVKKYAICNAQPYDYN